tara:strand:- start:2029 stop:2253 length:225 start_codon:yes stop_codon:yes gene_type:complete
MAKICSFCYSKNHPTHMGIVSTESTKEKNWYCAYYCLYADKYPVNAVVHYKDWSQWMNLIKKRKFRLNGGYEHT